MNDQRPPCKPKVKDAKAMQIVLVAVITLALMQPCLSVADSPSRTLFTNIHVFDGESEKRLENANVLVTAFVTTTTWVSGGCYPSWGYWYPYSGWCYPVAYTYSTGTIVISMAEPDSQNEAQIIWFAGINGILEGGTAGISSRIDQNIDQAFNQSDYLGDGK
jgi:hypothetical protein